MDILAYLLGKKAGGGGGGGISANGIADGTSPSGAVAVDVVSVKDYAFCKCSSLDTLHVKATNSGSNMLQDSSCRIVVAEGAFLGNYNRFIYAHSLEAVDFGADVGFTISNGYFNSCDELSTIIIRKPTLLPMAAVGCLNNTPFSDGGTGGTLYVPSSLMASYQAATNWSTFLGYANNQIKAIEGSIYETQYADGTLIT